MEICIFVSFPPGINIAVYAHKWKPSSVGIYLLWYQSHSKGAKSTGQYKGKVSTLNIVTAWGESLVESVSRRFVFIGQSASTRNAISGMNTRTSIQDKVVQTRCDRSLEQSYENAILVVRPNSYIINWIYAILKVSYIGWEWGYS